MADLRVSVTDYVPEIVDLLDRINASEAFPNVMLALDEISNMMHETWVGFASGVPIPGSPRVIHSRGAYIRSIKQDNSNPNEKVIYSDSVVNQWIEDGSDAVDLKPGLLNGPKAKFGKNGPYNVVAFRHGVPGSVESNNPMPPHIYTLGKINSKRQALAAGGKKNLGDHQVIPNDDKTGIRSKLVSQYSEKTKKLGNYTWKSGKYAGMQRISTSTGKAQRSSYITFRVVSAHSDPSSWIRPPIQPVPIRQIVVDTVREIAVQMIQDAIQEDLK